jgi:hypothetical protein
MRVAVLLLALSGFAHADDWTRTDTARQAAYTVLHLADWAQTRYIATHANFSETNVMLEERPSLGRVNNYFAATLIGHYAISAMLPAKYRPTWQYGTITIEAYCVLHNRAIGIGMQF